MGNAGSEQSKKSFSPDWFLKGLLSRIGDTFDRFTGRNWKPSSSLATSELIEKLILLIDAELKLDDQRTFAPHNFKLKMQWDKFSADSERAIEKLRIELQTAAIDHINDKRYYTYAPTDFEIVADYFTEGVKLSAGFESYADSELEGEVKVSVPKIELDDTLPDFPTGIDGSKLFVTFEIDGQVYEKDLNVAISARISIGRTGENNLVLDDPSVSKNHASIAVNSDGQIILADTGSTNGTYINDDRIAYGKAITVNSGETVRFGSVEASIRIQSEIKVESGTMPTDPEASESYSEIWDSESVQNASELDLTEKGIDLNFDDKPNTAD